MTRSAVREPLSLRARPSRPSGTSPHCCRNSCAQKCSSAEHYRLRRNEKPPVGSGWPTGGQGLTCDVARGLFRMIARRGSWPRRPIACRPSCRRQVVGPCPTRSTSFAYQRNAAPANAPCRMNVPKQSEEAMPSTSWNCADFRFTSAVATPPSTITRYPALTLQ